MGQRKVIQCLHDEKIEKKRKDNNSENTRANGEGTKGGGKDEGDRGGKAEAVTKTKQAPIKLNPSLQARKREI